MAAAKVCEFPPGYGTTGAPCSLRRRHGEFSFFFFFGGCESGLCLYHNTWLISWCWRPKMLPGAQQPISNGGETKLFFCPRHGKELWLWEVTPSCSTSFDQTPKGSIISEPPLIGLGCFLTSSVWEFCSVPPSIPPPPLGVKANWGSQWPSPPRCPAAGSVAGLYWARLLACLFLFSEWSSVVINGMGIIRYLSV